MKAKKLVVLAMMGIFCYACGNNADEKSVSDTQEPADNTQTETAPAESNISSNPAYKKGLSLIGNSDCLTCHKVDDMLIGPSYRDVANKYEKTDENIAMLAGKIISGGSGNWGEVMMTAHPDISQDDAKAMVEYIFLLKNN